MEFIYPKTLWFDCETTGTDPVTHGIIQLSAIVEENNEIKDEINLFMKPVRTSVIDPEALKVSGITEEQIAGFMEPEEAHKLFYDFLKKNGGVKSKSNRYVMGGYNAQFDCDFMCRWFQDITGNKWSYWDYLQFSPIDALPALRMARYCGLIKTADTKLSTMCEHFGIPLKAHDALEDIRATRTLTHLVLDKLRAGWMKDIAENTVLIK